MNDFQNLRDNIGFAAASRSTRICSARSAAAPKFSPPRTHKHNEAQVCGCRIVELRRFLINEPAIRNHCNSLKTNSRAQF